MKKLLKDDHSGQILIVVLIIIVVLLLIILAVVFNVISDIGQSRTERQYEEGYNAAEEALFQIGTNTDIASIANKITAGTSISGDLTPAKVSGVRNVSMGTACIGQSIDGILGGDYHATGNNCSTAEIDTDANGTSDTLCSFEPIYGVFGVEIAQDEVLEVNLIGYAGAEVTIEGISPGASIAVVYLNSSGYYVNKRYAVQNSNNPVSGSGFTNFNGRVTIAQPGLTPQFMRVRAIGGSMTLNVIPTSAVNQLPAQMLDVICRGTSSDTGLNSAEGSPVPLVYSQFMTNKRLPAIFDYVLFVGNGDIEKN